MIKIYSLHHPITGELRYIGKTKESNLIKRLQSHISAAKTRTNRYKCINWIKSLYKDYLIPEIYLIDEVLEEEWAFWEIFYINYFKSIGCRLTNTTNGGDRGFQGNKSGKRVNKPDFGTKKKIPILQYSKDFVFIKEHLSALDAYKETGIWKESIRNCCNNRSKSAGGYIWTYKNKKL